jgi:hypothetical protein
MKTCEAKRRRRISREYRLTGSTARPRLILTGATPNKQRREGEIAPALPGRDEPQISLCVIVESADVFHVRRAVFQAGGQSVQVFKGLPMPRSSKVRLYVTMKAGALDQIRNAVMTATRAGEFGLVRRVP